VNILKARKLSKESVTGLFTQIKSICGKEGRFSL
jgi:hypothetical protein